MGNCLVSKLKSAVSNPNLPVLNELVLEIGAPRYLSNGFLWIGSSHDDCIVTAADNIVITNSSGTTTYTPPIVLEDYDGLKITRPTTNGYLHISRMDHATPVSNNAFGVAYIHDGIKNLLLYIPLNTEMLYLYELQDNTYTFDEIIDIIKHLNINNIDLQGSPIIGNISSLNELSGFKNLGAAYMPNLQGDISSIASITTIENLAISGTNIEGTIESFVAGQRAAGRTTGTVTGNSAGWGKVTFNGATTHAKGTVSWTATTITMDGVTINA